MLAPTMQVDRARFLLLTASMSAGACASAARTVDTTAELGDDDGIATLIVTAPPVVAPTDLGGSLDAASPAEPEPPEASARDARSCGELQPPMGPYCEGFETTRIQCARFDDILLDRQASVARECVLDKSGTDALCETDAVSQCFDVGLLDAAPTAVPEIDCGDLTQSCSGLTLGECRSAGAAVKKSRRAELLACISESCSVTDCFYYF